MGVHAVEAVVRRRDGGREHLPLVPGDRGAREVVNEQLVGESAQVDAEGRGERQGRQDAWDLREPADDRLLL